MGSKPAVMKDKVKYVHKSRVTGQKVTRVKYVVNGHGRMAWMSEDGKVWPGQFVELRPEKEDQQ